MEAKIRQVARLLPERVMKCATTLKEDHRSERRYALSEIDRMRSAIRTADAWNSWYPHFDGGWVTHGTAESYAAEQRGKEASIEDRLRTYMVGGVSPEELEAQGEAAKARQKIRQQEHEDKLAEERLRKEYGPRT